MEKTMSAPIPASKMKLESLIRGRQKPPIRMVLFGPEGCGKSTFASHAPAPIFLGTEDGTAQLDVVRFPAPSNWADVLEAVRVLTVEDHAFKTLVIDTLDWAEPLAWQELCAKAGVTTIEDVGGGYGKGFTAAVDMWRALLANLERMQKAKSMNVLLLAHSHIKSFKNPAGPDYDRYELKLNQKAAGLMKEWADAVLFANHETYAVADKAKRVRGISTGVRLLYTDRTASHDAKNRYGLPAQLPLSWADFEAARNNGQPVPDDELRAAIAASAERLAPDIRTTVLAKVAGLTGQKLVEANNWVAAQVTLLTQSTPNTQSKES